MKTIEDYKFNTNTDYRDNVLGFVQGQIRQYVAPDGHFSRLFDITLYTERDTLLFKGSMTDIHFVLTPRISVPYEIMEEICKEIMESLNKEYFSGHLNAEFKNNMIIYSSGSDNRSIMVGAINGELSFNICFM